MTPHKFTYRAPQLVKPISELLEFLSKKKKILVEESNKDKQFIQEHKVPVQDIDHPLRMRMQGMVTKIKAIDNMHRKYALWLNECQRRTWFTKYELDEGDLQELYQYKFMDSN